MSGDNARAVVVGDTLWSCKWWDREPHQVTVKEIHPDGFAWTKEHGGHELRLLHDTEEAALQMLHDQLVEREKCAAHNVQWVRGLIRARAKTGNKPSRKFGGTAYTPINA